MPVLASSVLAHGIGSRSDLPIPLWLAIYAGAMAVLISFFAVVAFWPTPRLRPDAPGLALPVALQRAADAPATRAVLRVIGVAALAVVLAVAWLGPDDSSANPAPTWFYVWFWVGLVPASVLLGPVWRRLNPLRGLTAALLAGRGGRPLRALPQRLGYWPAAVSVAAFVWLELVWVHPDRPRTVAIFVTLYALLHTAAGVIFGQRWFDRGDGFEAYSSLLGRLSVLSRRPDGRLTLRNPLHGLTGIGPAPGLVALVCVVLGSTAFDGLSRTPQWKRLTNGTPTPVYVGLGTLGLAIGVLIIVTIFLGAMVLTRPYALSPGLPARFAHSLVPIAVGYTTAHYFSLAVFQGQAGFLLATDPFGKGWDLFGTEHATINYTVVSTSLIAIVQVAAIVAGHIVGVVAAHDRAVAVLPRHNARRGQYPLLTAMVIYTGIGIALLVGT
jgi:hypothetical protein